MKLSYFINQLELLKDRHGDLDVCQASDPEGGIIYKVVDISLGTDEDGERIVIVWPTI